MNNLKYLMLLLPMMACTNQDMDFPDYEYNAVYFPIQYPVRTLVLGEDRIDNSLDKELKFHIGVSIGGMYQNSRDWHVDFVKDPSLAENLVNTQGYQIRVLPDNYYTLTPSNRLTIPAGSFNGLAQVQLTDAFLDDPLAMTGSYVIPLRITGTDADSVLTGKALYPQSDRNVPGDWDPNAKPKDFVLFGIKYINPFHGAYFHRGRDVAYNASNEVVGENIYRQKFVENDQIWKLATTGRNNCNTNGVGANVGDQYGMKLSFEANGNVIVSQLETSPLKPSGTGKYVVDGGEWGGKKYPAIYLNYSYSHEGNTHVVHDTLVFRNNGVVYEENSVIKN